MLRATPGELWQTVEPAARARPGWVAFAPREPTAPVSPLAPYAMRALLPAADGIGDLEDHICSVEEARELLSLANYVASAYMADGSDPALLNQAAALARDALTTRATLGKRYETAALVSAHDAEDVAAYVEQAVWLAQSDARTEGTLTIQDRAQPLYALVGLLLSRPTCTGRPIARPRFKWWLIPLVLIGTSLVLYGELEER